METIPPGRHLRTPAGRLAGVILIAARTNLATFVTGFHDPDLLAALNLVAR